MTTRIDTEEIESTRSEKFVAFVLAAFLLIGTGWFYVKADDWARDISPDPSMTASEVVATKATDRALERESDADFALEQARTELEVARDDQVASARERFDAATREAETARKTSIEAAEDSENAQTAYQDRVDKETKKRSLVIALVRLAFIAAWTAGSFVLIGRMRRRESRYLPLGFAAVGAGTILALVFAVDYITDYIDPLDLGPFVLAAFGCAATIGAFAVLQRHLAQRIPGRRVRKGDCPFCGFPVRGDGPHCEGCGRDVVAECAACSAARRVGSPHCPTCGVA
jgi:hypothetical protein